MKREQMIEQLRAMSPETQTAPEFQKLLSELETPRRRRLTADDLVESLIDRSEHSTKPVFNRAALGWWLLVVCEAVAVVGILYHLYGYADVSLLHLTLGGVADIAASLIAVVLLFLHARNTVLRWRRTHD